MSLEREWVKNIQVRGEVEQPDSETWVISMDFPHQFNGFQTYVEITSILYNEIGEPSIKRVDIPLSVWEQMVQFVDKEKSFDK
ncbi:hypothetical protein CVD28_00550 [Bacillus sp. M6-12]|uniref:hypothetical protein n=1 Tax=Bacillus sp. M6-12 TaxID=2054166 RepID=UPI000C77DAF5|nr:hypothetical protein [Bacillus sp. M6-12]PLS18924.1 hypothetical protein CVD28_00550 [Bacillus sp. M6-12]